MTTRPTTLLLALLLATPACGDDGGTPTNAGGGGVDSNGGGVAASDLDPISCEYLAGDNCWRQLLGSYEACFPGSAPGTLDDTGSTCTFPDGVTVTFATPLGVPADVGSILWDFEVHDPDGAWCASFSETDVDGVETMTLTTSDGTVTQAIASGVVTLTCPDGTARQSPSLELFECDFADFPGVGTSSGGGLFTFDLLGDDEEIIGAGFECQDP